MELHRVIGGITGHSLIKAELPGSHDLDPPVRYLQRARAAANDVLGGKLHHEPPNVLRGRVLSVTDSGAFIELEQGIEGLVHVAEMTWSKRMKHPSKMVKPGDEVDTIILSVNPNDRRISLGMKQLQENPWEQLEEKYPTGAIIEGRVRNLTDFGAFIEIEDGIDGLVHVSNLSWTKRIKHPSELLRTGEEVKSL